MGGGCVRMQTRVREHSVTVKAKHTCHSSPSGELQNLWDREVREYNVSISTINSDAEATKSAESFPQDHVGFPFLPTVNLAQTRR